MLQYLQILTAWFSLENGGSNSLRVTILEDQFKIGYELVRADLRPLPSFGRVRLKYKDLVGLVGTFSRTKEPSAAKGL